MLTWTLYVTFDKLYFWLGKIRTNTIMLHHWCTLVKPKNKITVIQWEIFFHTAKSFLTCAACSLSDLVQSASVQIDMKMPTLRGKKYRSGRQERCWESLHSRKIYREKCPMTHQTYSSTLKRKELRGSTN